MIEATMSMINYSFQLGLKADYYHLISGQDYPVKSNEEIRKFFDKKNGQSFLEYFSLPSEKWYLDDNGKTRYQLKWYLNKEGVYHYSDLEMKNQLFNENDLPEDMKPYGGSQWWSLHYNCVKYLHESCNNDNPLFRFYRYSLVPDEMMFHTMLLNSKFKNTIENINYRWIKWDKLNPAHPEILTIDKYSEILQSGKLFARKFDPFFDHDIIDRIDLSRKNPEIKNITVKAKQREYLKSVKCCVISAVGKASLHKKWVAGNANLDLHLLVYDDSYDSYKNDTPFVEKVKGQKFKLIYNYLSRNKQFITEYEYFYMPDDDIDIDSKNINKLFMYMKEYGLDIAQPAVYNNNITFKHTLKHHMSMLRYTNFVEVMQPCFSRYALEKIVFTFDESDSGWGIDYHWGSLLDFSKFNMAVIDDVMSIHTRPVQSNHIIDLKNYIEKFNLNYEIFADLK